MQMTMNQLATFDYGQLATETRTVVERKTGEIKALMRQTAENIVEIGKKLIEVKQYLGYGNFWAWQDAEFPWGHTTATKFMNIARKYSDAEFLPSQSIEALALLAAPSTPDEIRQEAQERARSSEPVTYTDVRGMVEEYKSNGRITGTDIEGTVKELKRQKGGDTDQLPDPWIIDGPTINGPVGRYRQNGDTKQCERCHELWAADLDYCPYCNISPAVRALHLQREKLPVSAANHTISDTPGYDGDEWYTPVEYIEAARALMGTIDLDPASCEEAQEVIKAGEIFTKDNDGLVQSWFGNVWLNPPYSMPLIKQFVGKLIAEYEGGRVDQAVIITNNSSDTSWFHDLLSRYPACFTRGRVSFWRPNHEAFGTRQGQTIFYLGNNVADFANTFSRFGIVVVRCDDT